MGLPGQGKRAGGGQEHGESQVAWKVCGAWGVGGEGLWAGSKGLVTEIIEVTGDW